MEAISKILCKLNDSYFISTIERKFGCINPRFLKKDNNTIIFTTEFNEVVEQFKLQFTSINEFKAEDSLYNILRDLYTALFKAKQQITFDGLPKWIDFFNARYPEEK